MGNFWIETVEIEKAAEEMQSWINAWIDDNSYQNIPDLIQTFFEIFPQYEKFRGQIRVTLGGNDYY